MVRVANGTATEEDVSGLNHHVPSARTAEYRNLTKIFFHLLLTRARLPRAKNFDFS